MDELGQIIGYVAAFVSALVVFLAKDWFRFRINGGKYVTIDACTQCRAQCRSELAKELEAGDKSFQDIKRDISTMKSAMVGVVLALIPICEAVTGGKVDCSELQKIARTLAE